MVISPVSQAVFTFPSGFLSQPASPVPAGVQQGIHPGSVGCARGVAEDEVGLCQVGDPVATFNTLKNNKKRRPVDWLGKTEFAGDVEKVYD